MNNLSYNHLIDDKKRKELTSLIFLNKFFDKITCFFDNVYYKQKSLIFEMRNGVYLYG